MLWQDIDGFTFRCTHCSRCLTDADERREQDRGHNRDRGTLCSTCFDAGWIHHARGWVQEESLIEDPGALIKFRESVNRAMVAEAHREEILRKAAAVEHATLQRRVSGGTDSAVTQAAERMLLYLNVPERLWRTVTPEQQALERLRTAQLALAEAHRKVRKKQAEYDDAWRRLRCSNRSLVAESHEQLLDAIRVREDARDAVRVAALDLQKLLDVPDELWCTPSA